MYSPETVEIALRASARADDETVILRSRCGKGARPVW